jgi:hypothetical protein
MGARNLVENLLRKTGLFSFLAFSKASSPHGYQSTGL